MSRSATRHVPLPGRSCSTRSPMYSETKWVVRYFSRSESPGSSPRISRVLLARCARGCQSLYLWCSAGVPWCSAGLPAHPPLEHRSDHSGHLRSNGDVDLASAEPRKSALEWKVARLQKTVRVFQTEAQLPGLFAVQHCFGDMRLHRRHLRTPELRVGFSVKIARAHSQVLRRAVHRYERAVPAPRRGPCSYRSSGAA